ncbi:MAG: carboxypeptidase-like regulatory domain-containing protein, partial [Calditrichaceae bacterium]
MKLQQIVYQIILLLFIFISTICAKETIIEGTIRHANTYQEIPYVNIFIKNQPIGTSSELDGSFKLNVPESNDDTIIVFEHISYDTLQLTLEQAVEK